MIPILLAIMSVIGLLFKLLLKLTLLCRLMVAVLLPILPNQPIIGNIAAIRYAKTMH